MAMPGGCVICPNMLLGALGARPQALEAVLGALDRIQEDVAEGLWDETGFDAACQPARPFFARERARHFVALARAGQYGQRPRPLAAMCQQCPELDATVEVVGGTQTLALEQKLRRIGAPG